MVPTSLTVNIFLDDCCSWLCNRRMVALLLLTLCSMRSICFAVGRYFDLAFGIIGGKVWRWRLFSLRDRFRTTLLYESIASWFAHISDYHGYNVEIYELVEVYLLQHELGKCQIYSKFTILRIHCRTIEKQEF